MPLELDSNDTTVAARVPTQPPESPRVPITDADIERLISQFNFARVYVAMLALDWRWRDAKAPPTIAEMKDEVRGLAQSVKEGSSGSATGGFMVYLETTKYGSYLGMNFTLEEKDQILPSAESMMEGRDPLQAQPETEQSRPKVATAERGEG